MTGDALQTEHQFTLPRGYADDDGQLHQEGVMRLATAADEIKPLNDPRVQSNSSYLTVILLSRVVTKLGDLDEVTPAVVESLFVSDLEYLQDLYESINARETVELSTACPDCGEEFSFELQPGREELALAGDGGHG